MAIKNNLQDDELEQQQQGQGLNTSGTQSIADAAGPGAVNGPTAPTGSGFVNLDQYLKANDGSGAKLAGDATADLASQTTDYTKTAANTAQQATTDYTKTANDAKAQSANLQQGIANDANGNATAASKFLGVNYTAPDYTKTTGDLAAKAGTLNDNLKQVDDSDYQKGLLQSAYGKNQPYTSGFGALDSFLINGSQDGRDAIGAVKGKQADVTGALQNVNDTVAKQDAAARQAFADSQNALKGKAHDLFSQRDSANNAKVAAMNSGLQREGYDGVKDYGLGDSDVTSDADRLNLQALASLSGDNYDAGKYNQRGGTQGTLRPVAPPPPPVVTPASDTQPVAPTPTGPNDKSLADVGGFTAVQNAGTNIKNAATPVNIMTPETAMNNALAKYLPKSPAAAGNSVTKYVAPRLKALGR